MTTYSASEIATGYDMVLGIIGWKLVNWIVLNIINLPDIVNVLYGVLPTFIYYDFVMYLVAFPFQAAS